MTQDEKTRVVPLALSLAAIVLLAGSGPEGEKKEPLAVDREEAKKALSTILENYDDKEIIALTGSFAKRGRLTLQGDVEVLNLPDSITKKGRGIFSQHNKARLSSKTEFEGQLRKEIIDMCKEFSRTDSQE